MATLAAREVADGVDLEQETVAQLLLLLRELRAAETRIEQRVSELTEAMARADRR